jgi:hypothetical protein
MPNPGNSRSDIGHRKTSDQTCENGSDLVESRIGPRPPHCERPRRPAKHLDDNGEDGFRGGHPPLSWDLMTMATATVYAGVTEPAAAECF